MTTIPRGLWLPLVTPFRDGAVDLASYERLLRHYLELGIDGLFPLGTTGEAPTLNDAESEALVARTLEVGSTLGFHNFSLNPNSAAASDAASPREGIARGFNQAKGGASLLVHYAATLGVAPRSERASGVNAGQVAEHGVVLAQPISQADPRKL